MIYPLKGPDFDNTAAAFSHHPDVRLKKAYWLFYAMNKPWLVRTGIFLAKLAFKLRLPVKPLIRYTVFQHFCGGETISQCRETIQKLGEKGVGTILDYSVEGKESESSFDHTLRHLLNTVETAAGSENIPFAVFKVTGLASTTLLEKFQKQETLSPAEEEQLARARERIHLLCQKAYENRVRIFFDAEESWIQDAIDLLCYEMMALFNKEKAVVYNTYQFYRRDMSGNYEEAFKKAAENGYFLGAKLVRGAYMEKERLRAEEYQYPDPIHASKEATDRAYNEAVRFSLAEISRIAVCLGTHNEESCRLCAAEMLSFGIDRKDERIYFAQLLGMSDNISFNMALAGYNVAKYVPFGPIEAVMPYLFRRANENTAIAGQSSREFLLIRRELQRRKGH